MPWVVYSTLKPLRVLLSSDTRWKIVLLKNRSSFPGAQNMPCRGPEPGVTRRGFWGWRRPDEGQILNMWILSYYYYLLILASCSCTLHKYSSWIPPLSPHHILRIRVRFCCCFVVLLDDKKVKETWMTWELSNKSICFLWIWVVLRNLRCSVQFNQGNLVCRFT